MNIKNTFIILIVLIFNFSKTNSAALRRPIEEHAKILKNYAGYNRMLVELTAKNKLTPEFLKLAILNGANINGLFWDYGSSSLLLIIAAFNYYKADSLKVLIDAKADIHVRSKRDGDQTPLHLAARCNNVAAAKILVEAKADINSLALELPPLNYCNNQPEIIKFLIENNASVEYLNNDDHGSFINLIEYFTQSLFPNSSIPKSITVMLNANVDYNFINKKNKTGYVILKEAIESLNWGFNHFDDSSRREKAFNELLKILEDYSSLKISNSLEIIYQQTMLPLPIVKIISKMAFGLVEE